MFVPQLPYIPLGDLRAVVSYPTRGGRRRRPRDPAGPDQGRPAAPGHPAQRRRDWAKVLSVGEQQRIAFARILLTKPRAVFLDESTSAMDEGLELMLYELIRAELPGHDSGQREPPQHGGAVPRPSAGAGRRRRMAARPAPDQELRPLAALPSRLSRYFAGMDEMFTPTLDWGNELLDIAVVDRQGLGDRGGGHAGDPGADRPVHHLGQTVLAHHRRLLHRSGERQGLDLAGRCCCCR